METLSIVSDVEVDFCIEALEEALMRFGRPEITPIPFAVACCLYRTGLGQMGYGTVGVAIERKLGNDAAHYGA